MSDVPSAVRAVRAAASSERAPTSMLPGFFRLEPSEVTGRLQVMAGALAVAGALPSTMSWTVGQRNAELSRLVNQANAYDELLRTVEELVQAGEAANAWRASWDKPPVIPPETLRRAKGLALGTRRHVAQVAHHAAR